MGRRCDQAITGQFQHIPHNINIVIAINYHLARHEEVAMGRLGDF